MNASSASIATVLLYCKQTRSSNWDSLNTGIHGNIFALSEGFYCNILLGD